MTMIIRDEEARDIAKRELLLDATFGPERHEKTCERLRAGRHAAPGLSFVAECESEIVGTLRLWHVTAGGCKALLLGPLAVSKAYRGLGWGACLTHVALNRAAALGHKAVILVGDWAYYQRFGFNADVVKTLEMPGPVDRARFLGLELEVGALFHAKGLVEGRDDEPITHLSYAPLRQGLSKAA